MAVGVDESDEDSVYLPSKSDDEDNRATSEATGRSLAELENDLDWEPSASDLIYRAFDASQPANQPVDLRGRDAELGKLLGGVLFRRNHAIVSGLRGSGKTSLLRVFGHLADQDGVAIIYTSCAHDTEFGILFRELLEQIPFSCVDPAKADLFESRIDAFGMGSTPLQVITIASMVEFSQVILVIDEFDRITSETTKDHIASTLKLISDRRLSLRVVLAGNSQTFSDMIESHQSLTRHLTHVQTSPLDVKAIETILDICASRCDMRFMRPAKDLLIQIASGSPYHARLFGMHSAISASQRGATEVSKKDVFSGLASSFEEWASTNQEDAVVFRSIVDGWHGNPEKFVELAKILVGEESEAASKSVSDMVSDFRNGKEIEELTAFGPALARSKDGIFFRDATAPQFLIALRSLAREQNKVRTSSERADV
jgi:hypothetical protein